MSMPAKTAISSLRKIASALEQDAKRLRALADAAESAITTDPTALAGSYFGVNVTDAVTSVLNTSGYIGSVDTAIRSAYEAAAPSNAKAGQ